MAGTESLFCPDVLRKIARLELRARQVVEGMMSGRHAGKRYGHAALFREHRPYKPGDDPRHIDWKVWARSDRFCVKQYDTETNLTCLCLVDQSASMAYANRTWSKYECAATLAASLAWLAVGHQDTIGCVLFDKQAGRIIPMKTQRGHAAVIATALEEGRPVSSHVGSHVPFTPLSTIEGVLTRFPRKGLVMILSDFLMDSATLATSLSLLRQQGRQVALFQVLDEDELDFAFRGSCRFQDLESSEVLACNPRLLREQYHRLIQDSLADLRHTCAKNGIDYYLVRTSDPVDVPLTRYLYRVPTGKEDGL